MGLALLAAGIYPLHASVTAGSPLTGEGTSDFPAVGRFGTTSSLNGSATAVFGGQFALTARHLVTSAGGITGELRAAADLRFWLSGTGYAVAEVFASFNADVALVRLASSASAWAEVYDGPAGSELNQIFTAAGFGQNDSDGDGRWGPGGLGIKKMFDNKVDAIISSGMPGQGMVLRYDFDQTSGDSVGTREGLQGNGDSGGGLFFWTGSEYQLGGVLSSAGDPINGATGSAVELAAYTRELATAVPEPASVSLLAAMYVVSSLRRRYRCEVIE